MHETVHHVVHERPAPVVTEVHHEHRYYGDAHSDDEEYLEHKRAYKQWKLDRKASHKHHKKHHRDYEFEHLDLDEGHIAPREDESYLEYKKRKYEHKMARRHAKEHWKAKEYHHVKHVVEKPAVVREETHVVDEPVHHGDYWTHGDPHYYHRDPLTDLEKDLRHYEEELP